MLKKNEKRTVYSLRIAAALFSLAIAFAFWHQQSVTAFAQGTAKVVAKSGNIREMASIDSTGLASVKRGDTLDVTASTTDSNGYTWYKVFVDRNSQGYIRSDLVTVEGTIPPEKTGSTGEDSNNSEPMYLASGGNVTTVGSGGNVTTVGSNNNTTSSATTNEETDNSAQEDTTAGVSPSQVLTARVKEKVRVRAGAGTSNYDVVGSADGGTEVNVSGEMVGEGGLWYQISFNDGNKTVSGFIREDFLEVLQTVPQESAVEEPIVEEPVESTPVNEDYHLQYMANEEGVSEWYLFDNVQGTSVKLNELLTAVAQNTEVDEAESKQLSTMKIIIIAMAVVLILLVVAVTVLLFKLRDSYEDYEDEEDDEEEEEDEEDEEDEEEEERSVRIPRPSFGKRVKREAVSEINTSPVSSKSTRKNSDEENKSWQSKDFLELDDDMEFEFLDL